MASRKDKFIKNEVIYHWNDSILNMHIHIDCIIKCSIPKLNSKGIGVFQSLRVQNINFSNLSSKLLI